MLEMILWCTLAVDRIFLKISFIIVPVWVTFFWWDIKTIVVLPDKAFFFNQKSIDIAYFFMKRYVVGTHRCASNEYSQHRFSWRNKKNIYLILPLLSGAVNIKKNIYFSICPKISNTKVSDKMTYANSADPDQTAPEGAVWSGSTLFAITLNILRNNCIKIKD